MPPPPRSPTNGGRDYSELDLSPLSEVKMPKAKGGFGYLKQPAEEPVKSAIVADEIPISVTRRPAAKRTNPFGDDTARVPVGSGAKQKPRDPFDDFMAVAAPRPKIRVQPAAAVVPVMTPQATPQVSVQVATSPILPKRSVTPKQRNSASSTRSSTHIALKEAEEYIRQQEALELTRRASNEKQSEKKPSAERVHVALQPVTLERPEEVRPRPSLLRRSLGRENFEKTKDVASFAVKMMLMLLVMALMSFHVVVYCFPLFMTFSAPEDALVKAHVHSLTQLQAVYQIPYYSLNESRTRCLYNRVLEEGIEELDRVVHSLPPIDTERYVESVQRLKQIVRAYHMVRHRARLYARSRERSVLNQFVVYPLRDAFVYGVVRHGWKDLATALLWKPSLADLSHRVWDVAVCLRQSEHMPCPSQSFLEEKTERKIVRKRREAGAVTPSVFDREALEFLEQLARDVIDSSGRSNDEYNERYCPRERSRS